MIVRGLSGKCIDCHRIAYQSWGEVIFVLVFAAAKVIVGLYLLISHVGWWAAVAVALLIPIDPTPFCSIGTTRNISQRKMAKLMRANPPKETNSVTYDKGVS